MKVRLARSLLISIACGCGCLAFGAAPESNDPLAKLSLEWVKTRSETVRAETEWSQQRDLLGSTVKAVEERARELEAKRDLLKAKTAKERTDLDTMEVENQRLADQLSRLEAHLKDIDVRLTKLRPQLPPKLSQALELPLLSLADPNLPGGNRMEHTMTVINRCIQFNRVITFGEEIITPPGESKPKVLQTVYWGLSHGYAYSKSARTAWIGAPASGGWRWTPNPGSEPSIREMIATFDEKAEPKFVAVPATAGRLVEIPPTK